MNRLNDVKDETIRHLAQTLKDSGLAASESEAIRMANNMASTNKKVNTNFEEKKERNTMGLSFLHKDYSKKENNSDVKVEEVVAQDPEEKIIFDESSEEDSFLGHDCSSCSGCGSVYSDEDSDLDLNVDAKDVSLNDLFEAETKDEFIAQDLINDSSNFEKEEEEKIPEKTQEIPVEPKKERDLSAYNEAKVDLGDVFKFKN